MRLGLRLDALDHRRLEMIAERLTQPFRRDRLAVTQLLTGTNRGRLL
jgi:hypothetical protein